MVTKANVIIADPSQERAQALSEAFSKAKGFGSAVPATDGETALKLVLETRPQVLVSNTVLPKLDGLTLIQRTRE